MSFFIMLLVLLVFCHAERSEESLFQAARVASLIPIQEGIGLWDAACMLTPDF
jgi:hypothetical protein